MSELKFKRLLVKLSGEALMGQYEFGIDPAMIASLADELRSVQQAGVEIGLVVGGGNIFRGAGLAKAGLDRVAGDQMGMLATVMNALALKDGLEKKQLATSVMSGLAMPQVCENYTQRDARARIRQGEIVIFAAGTGNPFFTTDTGASLRAIEIQADLMIKATKVDGIYDSDPVKNPQAIRYDTSPMSRLSTSVLALWISLPWCYATRMIWRSQSAISVNPAQSWRWLGVSSWEPG